MRCWMQKAAMGVLTTPPAHLLAWRCEAAAAADAPCALNACMLMLT
jgi:hypothetical protein